MKLRVALKLIDPNMLRVFLPWAIRHPKYFFSFKKLVKSYKNTIYVRRAIGEEGIRVPPFMILSITNKCNLKCAGCYAAAAGTLNEKRGCRMNRDQWKKTFDEAFDLGIFAYIIAGGEPFLFPELLRFCKEYNDRLFIIFTNGTAIKEKHYDELKKLKNTAVVVSLEGGEFETDNRRGIGVYNKVFETINKLNKKGIINGISATISRNNYKYWMDEKNIDDLIKKGVRIGFFMEYIPSCVGDDQELMLSTEEREEFRNRILKYRAEKKIYLIHSPGDEELMGGCVSAGRGFIHVTPTGDLTPCPVSSISTHNLKISSLKEGLASPIFRLIRENEELLETEGMPCALFAHQDKVKELAESIGAYIIN